MTKPQVIIMDGDVAEFSRRKYGELVHKYEKDYLKSEIEMNNP